MKKNIFSIMLIVLILMFISGCDRRVEYEFLQPNENIVKIEYVTAWYNKEAIVIKELSKDKTEEFLIDFKKINCSKVYIDPRSIESGDNAIKIKYINGDFELINEDGQASYKNGIFRDYGYYGLNDEQFQELINKYFK